MHTTGTNIVFPTEDNIDTLVTKIKIDRSSSIVVVPVIPAAAWFSEVKDLSCIDPFLVSLKDDQLFFKPEKHIEECVTKSFGEMVAIFHVNGNSDYSCNAYFNLNQSTKQTED